MTSSCSVPDFLCLASPDDVASLFFVGEDTVQNIMQQHTAEVL